MATANQNAVGGLPATSVHVSYSAGGVSVPNDCTPLAGGPFGVNPLITVQVVRAGLPSFFSRIWGNTGNTVSATATAEAFNPSASDFNPATTGSSPRFIPVV